MRRSRHKDFVGQAVDGGGQGRHTASVVEWRGVWERKLFARADGMTYSTRAEDRRASPESKAGRDRDSRKSHDGLNGVFKSAVLLTRGPSGSRSDEMLRCSRMCRAS